MCFDHAAGRSYGRRGKTPVIPGTGKRFRCNMISVISNRGRLHFESHKRKGLLRTNPHQCYRIAGALNMCIFLSSGRFDPLMQTKAIRSAARVWHKWFPSFAIPRKIHGLKIYFDFRDNPAYIASSAERLQCSPEFEIIASFAGKMIWDIGCNVGLFSLYASSLGCPVISFDISSKALRLFERSAAKNRLSCQTVNRAFSTRTFLYKAPASASTENRVNPDALAPDKKSMTYLEAASTFGIPQLIKMDIEGAEAEFIESQEFKRWILNNHITWLVELHRPAYKERLIELWPECLLKECQKPPALVSLMKLTPPADSTCAVFSDN